MVQTHLKLCLEERMVYLSSKHSYIYMAGISIHRGYAFVQYQTLNCAQSAANSMNGTFIGGRIAGWFILFNF